MPLKVKSAVIILFVFVTVVLAGQTRALKIVVVNKKDHPVRSVGVKTFPQGNEFRTDKSGTCLLEDMTAVDSIEVTFPGSSLSGVYATGNFTELHFNTSKPETGAYDPVSGTMIRGRGKRVIRKGELDVGYEVSAGARNLEDLLKRMPQLMITGGKISLRNPVQTKQFSDTSPLIVVDGIPVAGGLDEANKMVNINSIESVEVLRDGTLYGPEAINGVVVVKLKK